MHNGKIVEATKFMGPYSYSELCSEWDGFLEASNYRNGILSIKNLKNDMLKHVNIGDYVVKHTDGYFSTYTDEMFKINFQLIKQES